MTAQLLFGERDGPEFAVADALSPGAALRGPLPLKSRKMNRERYRPRHRGDSPDHRHSGGAADPARRRGRRTAPRRSRRRTGPRRSGRRTGARAGDRGAVSASTPRWAAPCCSMTSGSGARPRPRRMKAATTADPARPVMAGGSGRRAPFTQDQEELIARLGALPAAAPGRLPAITVSYAQSLDGSIAAQPGKPLPPERLRGAGADAPPPGGPRRDPGRDRHRARRRPAPRCAPRRRRESGPGGAGQPPAPAALRPAAGRRNPARPGEETAGRRPPGCVGGAGGAARGARRRGAALPGGGRPGAAPPADARPPPARGAPAAGGGRRTGAHPRCSPSASRTGW